MSTGENIKRIRNIRGMTQKELGIAIGIGEESASPRMHSMKLETEPQGNQC